MKRGGIARHDLVINSEIRKLFQALQAEEIRATKECVKDIENLVRVDVKKFAVQFFRDFTRFDFEQHNRFEKLTLNKKQKERIEGKILWRYEYRNNMNFRCIFILKEDYNIKNPILLCAFVEDGDKRRGINSYPSNIERAIRLIRKYEL